VLFGAGRVFFLADCAIGKARDRAENPQRSFSQDSENTLFSYLAPLTAIRNGIFQFPSKFRMKILRGNSNPVITIEKE
jgi:hypothetical protein